MPELPEVEFARRLLHRHVRRVLDVELHDPRIVRASTAARPSAGLPDGAERLRAVFAGRPEEPLRHGKRIFWAFGDEALVLHLGMTGRWTRRTGPHLKLSLQLEDGPLHYADPRLLGGVVPLPRAQALVAWRAGLGPDAWRDPLPRLRGKRAVKLALLDQSTVAGLGNLHAAEALWRARLDPRLPCDALDDDDHARLAAGVREQLEFAFTTLDGDEIAYVEDPGGPNPFPLYDREGEPCPRCGRPIGRFTQGGRSTWWCPACVTSGSSGRRGLAGPTA